MTGSTGTRSPRRSCRVVVAAAAAALLPAACGGGDGPTDPPPEPTTGTLEVSAATTGDTLDPDGYTVTLDGGESQALDADGTVTFEGVEEGEHEVAIGDVQANCSPSTAPGRAVTVSAGDTVAVSYDVACAPALFDRIVFSSRREGGEFDLHVMRTDGTDVTQLTDDAAFDNDPDITSDGTRLAFASGTDIAVMSADATGRDDFAGPSGQDFGVRWSPDDDRLVFHNFLDELWRMDADGTGLVQLTDNAVADRAPAWSPDGSLVAYGSDDSGSFAIWTVTADGSDPTRLTDPPAGEDFQPAWSPDGSRIAFASDRDEDGNFDIYTMAEDGSDVRRLTSNPAVEENPAWSPDGSLIAFESNRDGNPEIYVIAPDGSGLARLTDDPEVDADPVWAPAR